MDPLSIASAAASGAVTCVKLATSLFTYVEEVRDVDSIVSALGSDLKILSTSLEGVSTALREHGADITAKLSKSSKVFKSLSICIIECEDTIGSIANLLEDAQDHGWLGRKVPRTATHFKVGGKLKELTLLRGQVTSLHTAMNLNIEMINLCLILQSRNVSTTQNAATVTGIRNLEHMMENLFTQLNLGPTDNLDSSRIQTFRQCLHSAQRLRYTASTILEDGQSTVPPSESGAGSINSLGNSSIIQKVTLWLSSSHLSLDAGNIDSHSDDTLRDGVASLSMSQSGESSRSTPNMEFLDHKLEEITAASSDFRPASQHTERNDQSDNKDSQVQGVSTVQEGSVTMDTISNSIDNASQLLKNGNHAELEKILLENLRLVKKLDLDMLPKVYDAQVMLSKSYMKQEKWTLAKDILLIIIRKPGYAGWYAPWALLDVAKVFYHSGGIEPARRYCMDAILLSGYIENQPLYEDSIQFMATLYDHLQDVKEAEATRGLLSLTTKQSMFDELRDTLMNEGPSSAAKYIVQWISLFYGKQFMKNHQITINHLQNGIYYEPKDFYHYKKRTVRRWLLFKQVDEARSYEGHKIPDDEFGLLALATIANHGPWVQLLLTQGLAKPNHFHILLAMKFCSYTVCQMLLDVKVRFPICDLIKGAAEHRNWVWVNMLLLHHRHCTNPNSACKNNLTHTSTEVIEDDVQILLYPLLSAGVSLGTIICQIIDKKRFGFMKLLLAQGNINVQMGNGRTPLIYAIEVSNFEMVRMILDGGADVELSSSSPYTIKPLFVAVRDSHLSITNELLRRGANPNTPSVVAGTPSTYPLHCAVRNQDLSIVQTLLLHNAATDTEDSFGKTPLHIHMATAVNQSLTSRSLEIEQLLRATGGKRYTEVEEHGR